MLNSDCHCKSMSCHTFGVAAVAIGKNEPITFQNIISYMQSILLKYHHVICTIIFFYYLNVVISGLPIRRMRCIWTHDLYSQLQGIVSLLSASSLVTATTDVM